MAAWWMWLVSIQHVGHNNNNLKYIKNITQLVANFNASVIDMKCKLFIEEAGELVTYNVVHPMTSI